MSIISMRMGRLANLFQGTLNETINREDAQNKPLQRRFLITITSVFVI